MTLRGPSGINKLDITNALRLGERILTDSGVPQLLQQRLDTRLGRGRPSHLPRYTSLAVLVTWFQLLYANQPPSIANILNALWFDYTPDHLHILRLGPTWRDPVRADRMQDHGIYRQEYDRLHTFTVDMLIPLDDTPVPATKNLTNHELATAATARAAELAPTLQLADDCSNAILAATIPPDLFTGWKGALSTDLTAVGVTPSRIEKPARPHVIKNGPPSASFYPRHRRLGGAQCIGVTFAIPVAELGAEPIPDVALGMALGHTTKGTTNDALKAIDYADQHPMAPTTGSNHRRWVIGDNAYTHSTTFNAALNTRGRDLLMEHSDRTGERRITYTYDLKAIPEDTDGPHLVPGAILCPAITGHAIRTDEIWRHHNYDHMTADELHQRQQRLDFYEAVRMPTDGRPKATPKRPPGRPRKTITDNPTTPDVFKIEVFCPARTGKLRCTRYPPSLTRNTPHYVNPPSTTTSYVCDNENPNNPTKPATTTIELTPAQFKLYGPLMAGTFTHRDLYKHARAHNEGFHVYFVMPEQANIDDRTIRGRRNSTIRITITLGAAIANIRSIDAYRAHKARNGGTIPQGQRAAIINQRRQLLNERNRDK